MTDRQSHILIVSLVLVGPIVTLICGFAERFYFTFYLFPVTIDSFFISFDPQDYKELRMVAIIVPLFYIKVFVIGTISLFRLSTKGTDNILLKRFYVLVFIISSLKLLGIFVINSDSDRLNFVSGVLAFLSWTIFLGLAIKKTANRTSLEIER